VTALDSLAGAKYVLLTTFRRDGRAVPTPVWAVRDGDALVVWTVAGSGKVKRIRRGGEVTVAPCTFRGRPLGEAVTGHATVTGPVLHDRRIRSLMGRKYGLTGRLSMAASRIRRGVDGTVGVRITVTG
jgi:PPOX class probable F420-dependent enzyme